MGMEGEVQVVRGRSKGQVWERRGGNMLTMMISLMMAMMTIMATTTMMIMMRMMMTCGGGNVDIACDAAGCQCATASYGVEHGGDASAHGDGNVDIDNYLLHTIDRSGAYQCSQASKEPGNHGCTGHRSVLPRV